MYYVINQNIDYLLNDRIEKIYFKIYYQVETDKFFLTTDNLINKKAIFIRLEKAIQIY